MNEHHNLFSEFNNSIRLLAANGILADDDPLLTQSFVEGETELPDMIAVAIKSIDNDVILLGGLKSHINTLKDRESRLKKRSENIRGLIELILMKFDISRVETPIATVSLRNVPPKISDIDEGKLPAKFFKQPDPVVDRKSLLEALKNGESIAGATLNNGGQTLQIRR